MGNLRLAIPLLSFAVLVGTPAFAQVDFTGEWAPLYHEDGPERGPGPELGDYTEMPINDAARMRADSYDADRISSAGRFGRHSRGHARTIAGSRHDANAP